jgi:hypothetical protein
MENKMNKPFNKVILALLSAGLFVFLLAGCVNSETPTVAATPTVNSQITLTPEAGMTESAPHVSPYIKVMVVDVEIRYLETNPVQVEFVIRGTLPDQCKYGFYSIENRGDQNVRISLTGIHPSDNSCLQTAQTIEYVLRLGRDMPEAERGFAPGDYELMVNNYKTTFSIKK